MRMLSVRVSRRAELAADIIGVDLEPESPGALPAFEAGAHIDVHLRSGMVRQYSLCNDPRETHRYRIAILRDPASRGGSVQAHEELQVGRVLTISPPRNHLGIVAGQPALLLAGGIGVTPLLAMSHHLSQAGSAFELHYCTRSSSRTAFLDELRRAPFADRVHFHFDDGPPAEKLQLHDVLRRASAETHLYVCGPAGFIQLVLEAAGAGGWPSERVHREYFAAPVADGAGAAQDGPFLVQLARTGQMVQVAAGESVVAALARSGIGLQMSCEQGVCGTCLTRVLGGEPDHRDMFLTEQEKARNDQFTPCCSRALSPVLVLDL